MVTCQPAHLCQVLFEQQVNSWLQYTLQISSSIQALNSCHGSMRSLRPATCAAARQQPPRYTMQSPGAHAVRTINVRKARLGFVRSLGSFARPHEYVWHR